MKPDKKPLTPIGYQARIDFDAETEEQEEKIFSKAFMLETLKIDVTTTRGGPAHHPYITVTADHDNREGIEKFLLELERYISRFKSVKII